MPGAPLDVIAYAPSGMSYTAISQLDDGRLLLSASSWDPLSDAGCSGTVMYVFDPAAGSVSLEGQLRGTGRTVAAPTGTTAIGFADGEIRRIEL